MLDGQDRPVGRLISWLDGRGRPYDAELTRELGKDFFAEHVGHGASGVAIGQVLRLRRESPERLRRPNRLGFAGDVIVGRLCGRRAHDPTSLSIAMLYNPWLHRADPEILARLGLEESQLPELLPAASAAGGLCGEVAGRLGLPAGIPVSPAVHNQYAAALGAGAVAPGQVNCGTGTAWVLLAATDRLLPPITEAFVCCHVLPGLYGQMLSLGNGGSAIDWVMNLLGQAPATPAEIDDLISSAPPGMRGPAVLAALGRWRRGRWTAPRRRTHHRDHPGPRALPRDPRGGRGVGLRVGASAPLARCGGSCRAAISLCRRRGRQPRHAGDHRRRDRAARGVQPGFRGERPFGAAMIARGLTRGGADLAQVARQWSATGRLVDRGPDVAAYRELLDKE